ncbi:MAG: gamma-glutamyl-gamma-aminobutyrate hydrolase family protein [Clostridia bacterium]|nr:gamma-glutamyl-gamma-aminobutyrate hydrolase family protein [Clostridia bacterium]
MKRPNIAITPSYTSDNFIRMRPAYLDAVWAAGGLPSFVSYTSDPDKLDQYAADFDAFLFAGGVDVDPKYYGEQVMFDSVTINAERDEFELALAERVIKSGKPVLGICRGIQLLNVALGGSLYQHIDGHSQSEKGNIRTQNVRLAAGTPLSDFADGAEHIQVNTFHHQAVKQVAPPLSAAAWSEDGICEAVYMQGHKFFVGVQWHPELFWQDDTAAEKLFRAFVAAVN